MESHESRRTDSIDRLADSVVHEQAPGTDSHVHREAGHRGHDGTVNPLALGNGMRSRAQTQSDVLKECGSNPTLAAAL